MKRREDIGEMDLWSEKQSTLPSKIDKMKGLTIEMTFEYPGVDGAKFLYWYRGRIIKLSNEYEELKYDIFSLYLHFLIFLGFQLSGISLCTLNCTSLLTRVLSSHSILN